mgnify:CR=1 FL=1
MGGNNDKGGIMEDKKVIATTYLEVDTYQKIRELSRETGIKVSALYEKLIEIGLKNFKGEQK